MNTAGFDILQQFSQLSDTAKQRVADFIGEQICEEQPPREKRPNGWIKEKIIIMDEHKTFPLPGWGKHLFGHYDDDFEPLDDFKEYM